MMIATPSFRKNRPVLSLILKAALPCIGFALAVGSSVAAERTWSGSGGTDWNAGGNWTAGVAPIHTTGSTGDIAVFTGTPTANQPNINTATRSVLGIAFRTASGGWTIGGTGSGTPGETIDATLSIGASGINASTQTSGTTTLNVNLNLINTGQTWLIGTGGTLAVNGTIIGSTSNYPTWTIGGTGSSERGTLILNGTSTRQGHTTINGGVVRLEGVGSLGTGNVTMNNANGFLDITGISAAGYTIGGNLAGRSTIRAAGKTLTVTGDFNPGVTTSAGLLTIDGVGSSLILGATSHFDLYGTTRGTSTGYDAVDVTGSLVYNGNLTINFSEMLEGSFHLFDFEEASGEFDSILIEGAFGDLALTGNEGIWTGAIGETAFTFTHATGDLTVTSIPEPSTALLLLVSSVAMASISRHLAKKERVG